MAARIYRPAKTATQSGTARTKSWILEYDPQMPRCIEPLMGWTGSSDMLSQVRLRFESEDAAIAYAKRHGLAYRLEKSKSPSRKIQSYADNFRSTRSAQWTH
jgi:hypothetical protein